MNEIWKDVIGYEELYEVSNLGKIRSKDRIVYQQNNGTLCKHLYNGKILKLKKEKNGYIRIRLSKNGKAITKSLHRIVAETFIPHDKENNVVNHLDNNPSNNMVSNLEWTTYKGNMQYAAKQGRMKYHPENLKKAQESIKRPVIAIDKDNNKYEFNSQVEAAKKLKCSRGHIAAICQNKYGYKTTNGYKFKYKEEL